LTLEQAEQIAVRNHPRIASASLTAQAAGAVVDQVKSSYYPAVSGSLTSAGADNGTAIAAGTLQTSALSSRAATGVSISQLVTDFGRTSNLVESAKLRAAAQDRSVTASRADVLVRVDRAFYATLAAEAVLKVAQATVDARNLTLRQVQALAKSSLKSTLDVSFAQVAVSEAELALYQAENNAKLNHAVLAAALGYERDEPFSLTDVATPPQLTPDVEGLVSEALNNRPDLAAVRLNQSAADRFAQAEKRLMFPSVSLIGVGGVVPVHTQQFPGTYGAAGVNVTIPVLNGGLFGARRTEAEFRARAAGKDAEDLSVQVASSVRVAWLEANNAFRRLDVTARLVEQASQALHLATARYEIGLGSILELTQAQLAQTSAQIGAVNARYDYLSRLSNLNYATGALR
jgi:outer membrane protein